MLSLFLLKIVKEYIFEFQLKRYEAGYVRTTAKIFSRQEIFQVLQLDLSTPYWILRKCAITLAYSGGLRCIELKGGIH
jgi:hypothetical protein